MSDTDSTVPEDASDGEGSDQDGSEAQDADQDDSGNDQGSPDVTSSDEEADISDDEREQLEKERKERLDPDNRPKNAEVDNSGREWDGENFKYAAGEEPGASERTSAIIGADRPDGVENDKDDER